MVNENPIQTNETSLQLVSCLAHSTFCIFSSFKMTAADLQVDRTQNRQQAPLNLRVHMGMTIYIHKYKIFKYVTDNF